MAGPWLQQNADSLFSKVLLQHDTLNHKCRTCATSGTGCAALDKVKQRTRSAVCRLQYQWATTLSTGPGQQLSGDGAVGSPTLWSQVMVARLTEVPQ